jgi:hypothetical protein
MITSFCARVSLSLSALIFHVPACIASPPNHDQWRTSRATAGVRGPSARGRRRSPAPALRYNRTSKVRDDTKARRRDVSSAENSTGQHRPTPCARQSPPPSPRKSQAWATTLRPSVCACLRVCLHVCYLVHLHRRVLECTPPCLYIYIDISVTAGVPEDWLKAGVVRGVTPAATADSAAAMTAATSS